MSLSSSFTLFLANIKMINCFGTNFGTSTLNPGTEFIRIFTVAFDRLG